MCVCGGGTSGRIGEVSGVRDGGGGVRGGRRSMQCWDLGREVELGIHHRARQHTPWPLTCHLMAVARLWPSQSQPQPRTFFLATHMTT